MAASYLEPIQRELDDNALPLSGAKLRFFVNNTTTPMVVYSNAALTVPIAQPVVSDAEGWYARVFIPQGIYRRTRHTPDDVLIDSEDDVDTGLSSSAGALNVAQGGTGANTAAGARSNLGVPSTSVTDSLDVRTTDLEGSLAAPLVELAVTTAYAATVALNFTANWSQQITLTGPLTLSAPTGTDGQEFRIFLIQDGTGSRAITLASAFKSHNSYIAFSRTAGAIDCIEGVVRGSDFHITGIKIQDVGPTAGPDIIIEDRKSSGTAGGTATAGSDQIRALNTEVFDRLGICSVASDQFTLSLAGTYYIEWDSPASSCNQHQNLLFNVTDAIIIARGTSQTSPASEAQMSVSVGSSYVTITAETTFEIRHRVQTTFSTTGFGVASSFGTEIYTRVKIWKVA
jgi:hypothetical protein